MVCWFQRGTAAEGNGERAVKICRCPAAVKRRPSAHVSQNARQIKPTRIDF
ncbi:hydrogenase accessory membrane domain protein [Synechococcus sp. M16.1]|nr:hydrogenase accessory membrane domain protein [Synechococcus sp. M16.1]